MSRERLWYVDVADVMNSIARGHTRNMYHGEWVSQDSLRMKTFLVKGLVCACCGLQAEVFALERDKKRPKGNDKYHLNLFGYNEHYEEVLFTHDHILARGLGGKDVLENAQTMCYPCNHSKGRKEHKMAESKRKEKK